MHRAARPGDGLVPRLRRAFVGMRAAGLWAHLAPPGPDVQPAREGWRCVWVRPGDWRSLEGRHRRRKDGSAIAPDGVPVAFLCFQAGWREAREEDHRRVAEAVIAELRLAGLLSLWGGTGDDAIIVVHPEDKAVLAARVQ